MSFRESLADFAKKPIPPGLLTPEVVSDLGTIGSVAELLDIDDEEIGLAGQLLPGVIGLIEQAKAGNLDPKVALDKITRIREAIQSTERTRFYSERKKASASDIKKLAARSLLLEIYLNELEALMTPISPERTESSKIALFNTLLRAAGIKEVSSVYADDVVYTAERKRVSQDVEKFIMLQMISQLKNVSNQYVVTGDPKFWSAITISTGLPDTPQYTLEQWINSIPTSAEFSIGGSEKSTDFLGETLGYLLDLLKWASSECGRAAMLAVYPKPESYVDTINSAAFVGIPFDRSMLEKMMTRDAGKPSSVEREQRYSVFSAFRDVMREILAITEMPTTSRALGIYKSALQNINMWPVGVKQGDPGVAPQQVTFDHIAGALAAKYPSTEKAPSGKLLPHPVIELAFRLAVAHCRHTGLEEYLDLRPLEVGTDRIEGKTRAVRSVSRLHHMMEWAKYSVEESGSARDPVAVRYAERHPAAALPADKLWFVTVDHGSLTEEMSVFEVLRQGLSDSIIPSDKGGTIPDDPTFTYISHMKYGLVHYQALFMKGGLKVLPDTKSMITLDNPATLTTDVKLATKLAKFAHRGQHLGAKDRDYLLGRLRQFEILLNEGISDPSKMTPQQRRMALNSLVYASFNMPQESPTSVVIKDGCDYYWDNTPIREEIFRELFQNPNTGGDHVAIMDAVRSGDKDLFVIAMFWTLVRAELERRSISEEEKELRKKQWENNEEDYIAPVETVSGQYPYTWAERMALKLYLYEMQLDFREKLRAKSLSKEDIDRIFGEVGVEGNEAVNIADLQWILVREPDVVKKHVKAVPAIFDHPIFIAMAKVLSVTQRERGTT